MCKRTLIVYILLFCTECHSATIGVICSVKLECDFVRRMLQLPLEYSYAGRIFFLGKITEEDVVVVESPMGKVQNTITATLLAERYKVSRILSIGSAGSITSTLPIGSVLYANKTVFHDQGRYLITGFESYEQKYPKVDLERIISKRSDVFRGLLASGDQFIANPSKAREIRRLTGAHAVDTNSAAIKIVCDSYGIKCSFLRYITDGSNKESTVLYQKSIRQNLKHLFLVERLIKEDPYERW
jgi:adenosylhomocysteine nucleosidase